MTYLSDFITTIKDWIDDYNPSDALATSWVRDGEERINNELRVGEMVVRGEATFDDNCAVMPPDWLETLFVKKQGGDVLNYISPDTYFKQANGECASPVRNAYTMIGKTMFVLPAIDPDALTKIDIGYYAMLVPLSEAKNGVFDRFPSVYRFCTLAAAAPYLIEDERLATFASLATAAISKANDAHKRARWTGSPLMPRSLGFG